MHVNRQSQAELPNRGVGAELIGKQGHVHGARARRGSLRLETYARVAARNELLLHAVTAQDISAIARSSLFM